MVTVAKCSVLVLGEDSAADGHATLVALSRRVLRQVDPYYDEQQVSFEPPKGAVIRGSLWKSTKPEDQPKRIDLMAYIATKLLEGDHAFVLYHVDGDEPWTRHEQSENARKLRQFIEVDVVRFIRNRRHRNGRPAEDISLARLLLMVPFRSIEAWVLQNTLAGRRFCQENDRCRGQHIKDFEAWERDRGLLDELEDPKDAVCFRDRHNYQLAGGVPIDEVYYAEKSLHATVNAWMENASLVGALAATRPE